MKSKETLKNKVDFVAIISVKNANPNGDPLNGNRPRENFEGYGEISDVCIKRKLRNRLQDMGERIFVQSDERCDDGFECLKDRAMGNKELEKVAKGKGADRAEFARIACESWIDVRSFGQLFAFDENGKKGEGISVGIRGPVSIHPAFSVSPVEIVSTQITKSVNGTQSASQKKGSDTMGMKHRVSFGLYVIRGSINCQLAEKTGFTYDDAGKIREALCTLFDNDASSARPEGSMEVCRVYWWEHASKTSKYSTAKIHRLLNIKLKDNNRTPHSVDDYDIKLEEENLDGVSLTVYNP